MTRLHRVIDRSKMRRYLHRHALGRAAQRGYDLDAGDLDTMIRIVGRDGPEVVTLRIDHSRSRRRLAVWFRGEWIPLVFDDGYQAVVTILPRDCACGYRAVLERARHRMKTIERRRRERSARRGPSYEELAAAVPPGELPPAQPDDGLPPVGTVLGRVEFREPARLVYTPPERPIRTIAEARARLDVLRQWRARVGRHPLSPADAEFMAAVKAERKALNLALERTIRHAKATKVAEGGPAFVDPATPLTLEGEVIEA